MFQKGLPTSMTDNEQKIAKCLSGLADVDEIILNRIKSVESTQAKLCLSLSAVVQTLKDRGLEEIYEEHLKQVMADLNSFVEGNDDLSEDG